MKVLHLMPNEDDLFTCSGCEDLLEENVPHDCPVLGTTVIIRRAITSER